jgi:hypothetical protein
MRTTDFKNGVYFQSSSYPAESNSEPLKAPPPDPPPDEDAPPVPKGTDDNVGRDHPKKEDA